MTNNEHLNIIENAPYQATHYCKKLGFVDGIKYIKELTSSTARVYIEADRDWILCATAVETDYFPLDKSLK